jgi:hypothetical protein
MNTITNLGAKGYDSYINAIALLFRNEKAGLQTKGHEVMFPKEPGNIPPSLTKHPFEIKYIPHTASRSGGIGRRATFRA